MLFGRIWERLGVADVLADLLKDRAFEFPVERAVFVAALHRLFVSGSDRDCSSWMEDYDIPGAEGLDLHHFYRAMAWLGEEMEEKPEGALAPRCVKDLIEEKLFDRRRDLFTDLSVVFMDTTSLSFYGEGGETLGEHGYSKDYRPDLKQMILGLVVDGDGRPICTEMWPGNTADVTTLLPVVDRLRRALLHRPGLRRRRPRHDLGRDHRRARGAQARIYPRRARALRRDRAQDRARERRTVRPPAHRAQGGGDATLRQAGQGRRRPLRRLPQRGGGRERPQGPRSDRRRARRATEEGRQGADRQFRLSALSAQGRGQRRPSFEIDAGKLAEEARFDGIFVLRTNAKVTPLQAVLRYRDLLQVEDLFRRTKAIMRTRPIFHSSDAAIRGHVFCSFLALAMQKHLDDLLRQAGLAPEWKELLRDLDRLQSAHPPSRRRLAGAHRRRARRDHAFQAPPMSPCRRAPARPVPRRQPRPDPPENAAAAQGVVPRQPEFRQNANAINCLRKSGVQVGLDRGGLEKVWDGLDVVSRIVTKDGNFHMAAPRVSLRQGGDTAMSATFAYDPQHTWFGNLDLIGFVKKEQSRPTDSRKLLQSSPTSSGNG